MSRLLSDLIPQIRIGNARAKSLLRRLCDYAADDGSSCFPSVYTLAEETELNTKTIPPTLQFLEEQGWIIVKRHNRNNTNSYEVNVEKIMSAPKNGCTQKRVHPKTGGQYTQKRVDSTPKNGWTVHPNLGVDIVKDIVKNSQGNSQSVEQHTTPESDQKSGINEPKQPSLETSQPVNDTNPTKPKKALTHVFDLKELPTEWKQYCIERRPDLDPNIVFIDFKAYFQIGKGAGKIRTDKGWASSFQRWVRNQKENFNSIQQTESKTQLSQKAQKLWDEV